MATLAQFEKILVRRTGGFLTFVSWATTFTGSAAPNEDLADAIAEGLRSVGIAPADPTQPTDSECGTVSDALMPQAFDVAELRLKMSLVAPVSVIVTQQAEQNRREYGQTMKALLEDIKRIQAEITQKYYAGAARIEVGPMYGPCTDIPSWIFPCC